MAGSVISWGSYVEGDVTISRKIAEAYGIRPGDQIEWVAEGDAIRISPAGRGAGAGDRELRVRLFDLATDRLGQNAVRGQPAETEDRGS